jgi:hypothetical protein
MFELRSDPNDPVEAFGRFLMSVIKTARVGVMYGLPVLVAISGLMDAAEYFAPFVSLIEVSK